MTMAFMQPQTELATENYMCELSESLRCGIIIFRRYVGLEHKPSNLTIQMQSSQWGGIVETNGVMTEFLIKKKKKKEKKNHDQKQYQ